MTRIPLEVLNKFWPHATAALKDAMCSDDADHWLSENGIDTDVKLVHFLAQVSHECGAGTVMEENLNYRAPALRAQWPSHFSEAQAEAMAHHPQLIANQAYNGRMGNRPGTDDGWNYRGRGGCQTTGREEYEKLGKATGLDLIDHPELVIDPAHFVRVCAANFRLCGCLPYASEQSDQAVLRVTKRLNGGTIGLDSRRAWFLKWSSALRL